MNPPRIEVAAFLPWPGLPLFTAIAFLFIPGAHVYQLIGVGPTPWMALYGVFVQAVALDGARRLRALSFMAAPERN